MLKSFRLRLAAFLVVLILLPVLGAGYLGYRATSQAIRSDMIARVGLVAEYKRELLGLRLKAQAAKARQFLASLGTLCPKGIRGAPRCENRQLQAFMRVERVSSARLWLPSGIKIEFGPQGAKPLRPGQLALFARDKDGSSVYSLDVTSPDSRSRILLVRKADAVEDIFAAAPAELGEAGEILLADSGGLFVTTPRYPISQVASLPGVPAPMQRCLSGESGEILAEDYRNTPVIHGFRHLPEIGGGCLMAHMEQKEAFAPLRALSRHIWQLNFLLGTLAAALSVVATAGFSRFINAPLNSLITRLKQAEAGDLESPVPIGGPTEIEILGHGVEKMIHSLRKSLSAREDFVSITSHDLKNPLAALKLQIAMIEHNARQLPGESATKLSEQSAHAQRTIQRMEELVNSMLDLANIKSGQFRILPETQNASLLVKELSDFFQPLMEKKGIHFTTAGAEIPVEAEFDRNRLHQVLSNLLSNALQHTPAGGDVHLTLKREHVVGGMPESVVFSVKDTGPGIPAAQRACIFDRFYQGKRLGRNHGAGLGLFISKEIVSRHQGSIGVNSEEGHGSEFHFRIPLQQPPPRTGGQNKAV